MAAAKTLLVVLAGGAGSRLESLTEDRAKPALRFGGGHRLIDFPLSHAANSGIDDVWVLEQFHPSSIDAHLAGGRPWDLDRTRGGLLLLGPHQGDEREGWHEGTADALWRKAGLIEAHGADVVLVASADAVYRMDYADVVERHAASSAQVTMVVTRHDGDCSRYGVVVTEDGAVVDYAYKPEEPRSDVVTTEVFAFEPAALLAELERVHRDYGEGEDGLGDLGDHVLPAMVERGAAREYRHEGYWQDVGTIGAYWRAHMDLLDGASVDLDDPAWPVLTRQLRHAGAFVSASGSAAASSLAAAVRVEGSVRRSVLSPGVHVAEGAEVVDSVLLDDVRVGPGARLHRVVVDEGTTVDAGTRHGEDGPDASITLVG